MKKRYAIGIDPGVQTGLAVYDRQSRQVVYTATTDFWAVIDRSGLWVEPNLYGNPIIIIECPKKTRLYERQDGEQGHRRREKIAANAGGNAREAELLAEGLERLGYDVRRVTPTRTKLNAEQFARRTGIKTKTSQHVRDAVMLVYGL